MTQCPKCKNQTLMKQSDCVWCTVCDFYADGDDVTEALQYEAKSDVESLRTRLETTARESFEAGFYAYREAFDHYDDENVKHSLEWHMEEFIKQWKAAQ